MFSLDDNNNIMFEDSDDELCAKLLDETEINELCKSMINYYYKLHKYI